MSKELEALKTVKYNSSKEVVEAFDVIEKALQRLESIDNANPSEAIECLKRVWNDINSQNDFRQDFKDLTIVENYILKVQEQEKMLKFIFKKQVDINEIKILLANLKHCDDIERCKRYNASRKVGYKLKQQEFDLLKRWLGNER